jgi:hypothetical protein
LADRQPKEKTNMKKILITTALAAGLTFASAGAASAGEVGGNGELTPIGEVPSSICAYSGLEDASDGGPGVTQTPAGEDGNTPEPGAARICSILNHGRG